MNRVLARWSFGCRHMWFSQAAVDNAMDGLTLRSDSASPVRHTSYLRLRPAFDRDGQEMPIEILKVQEITSRVRSIANFSVLLSYAYGERLLKFRETIASCGVCIEMDEFWQPKSQVEFSKGGSLVISEDFRGMGIDTFIMRRIALWLEQTTLSTKFPASAFRANQENYRCNPLTRDHGFDPAKAYGSAGMHSDADSEAKTDPNGYGLAITLVIDVGFSPLRTRGPPSGNRHH